ncbi:hypothetical protein DUI87_30799 [Hirundo rustica rustica]|uniref:Uncharacterized protein n=1 Tax=Hirundo rustica rustica TaxID=333673 RepID=A0A3M0J1S2_HIRRU|nr:hypothetical protein DUI87_30799 [Hirundo rustica rustica]
MSWCWGVFGKMADEIGFCQMQGLKALGSNPFQSEEIEQKILWPYSEMRERRGEERRGEERRGEERRGERGEERRGERGEERRGEERRRGEEERRGEREEERMSWAGAHMCLNRKL